MIPPFRYGPLRAQEKDWRFIIISFIITISLLVRNASNSQNPITSIINSVHTETEKCLLTFFFLTSHNATNCEAWEWWALNWGLVYEDRG